MQHVSRTAGVPAAVGIDERRFAHRLQSRDVDAWSTLYSAHYDRLYRYAMVRLASREEAEDVTNAVFTRALARIDSFEPRRDKSSLAWLFGISKNVIRERRRKPQRETEVALPSDLGGAANGTPAAATDSIETLDLERALNSLTRPQREVISLMHIAGFTAREIAFMLGKTPRSVYYLEARALTNLKRDLDSDDESERTQP